MSKFITPALAFIFFLAAASAYAYVYLDITASASTIASAQSEIASNASKDAFAKSAEDFLNNTTAERAQAAAYVTAIDDTASAIELVGAAGKPVKVTTTVSSATITSLDKKRFHEELDVVASATGPFTSLARLGTTLESLPRASSMKSIHMEAVDKGWYATFTLAFIKVATPKPATAAQKTPELGRTANTMNYLNKILEWIKSFGTPYPRRDWLTVLSVSIIIGIGLIAFAGYVFFGIKNGALIAASVPDSPTPAPSVSRAQMTKVLDEYQQRATNYNAQNIPTYTLFDPHLVIVKK